MNTENFVKRNKKLLVICAVGVLLISVFLSGGSFVQQGTQGYLSGTQGLQFDFNSVRWNGSWWSNTEQGPQNFDVRPYGGHTQNYTPGAASSLSFGPDNMQLDPDGDQIGMPDLCASTQVLTRDSDDPVTYSWSIPQGSSTLSNGTIVQKTLQFEMFKYRMSWSVNLWLGGSEWEADGKYNAYPDLYVNGGCYSSAAVWLKIIPQNFVYFNENPERVFFAPTYIALKEPVQWIGIDNNGKQTLNDPDISRICDIIPKATGEAMGIYYSRGGATEDLTTSKVLQYQGATLDPRIFRSEYWTKINLIEFQADSWNSWGITHGWKFPSAHLNLLVDMFVVGQWTVFYKTGEVPKLEGHTPITQYSIIDQFLRGIADIWSNPFTQLWLFFIIAVVVFGAVVILNPGLLSYLFRRRKHEG